MVWVVGHFETSGERDYPALHALQHQITLTPLGRWSRGAAMLQAVPLTRGIDHKVTPAERVAKMNASEFFARLNALMIDNPPGVGDGTALNHLAPIGVGPGLPFDVRHDPIVARSVDASARTALARIVVEAKRPSGQMVQGWWTPLPAGRYGDDYMRRAVVALANFGASLPEDGVYLRADVDSEEHPLSGAERYVLRFASGELPPTRGIWSIAIYNSRQALVPNPIHRHAFTSRDRLAVGADGSVTLYLQHTSPGRAHESNWLPTPLDHFTVVIRVYWPRREVLNHRWRPPAVHRVR
jgi:hypothetical protein